MGNRVLVWGTSPPILGHFSLDSSFTPIPAPDHAWGDGWPGPLALLPNGQYAVAPVGDARSPRVRPHPWVPGRLLVVIDSAGMTTGAAGLIQDEEGEYLPWLGSRLGLGAVADTVLAVTLSDGVLHGFPRLGSTFDPEGSWSFQLPVYLDPPNPVEEVRRLPWIQVGGDRIKFLEIPHVKAVTFGPRGHVFAIRNYAFRWRRFRDALFTSQGQWEASKSGLEVYSHRGQLEGAFVLPGRHIRWLRVDRRGRMLIRTDQSLVIGQDPTAPQSECQSMPSMILVPNEDLPQRNIHSSFPLGGYSDGK